MRIKIPSLGIIRIAFAPRGCANFSASIVSIKRLIVSKTFLDTFNTFEPHDKTNKVVCAPSEDSDEPGHPPCPIRLFAIRTKKAWFLSYSLNAQRRLWSDWADAQADPSLRWAHSHFLGFVMRRLIFFCRNWRYEKFCVLPLNF